MYYLKEATSCDSTKPEQRTPFLKRVARSTPTVKRWNLLVWRAESRPWRRTKRWAAYIWKALTRHSENPTAATKRRSLKFHRESPGRPDVSSSLYEFRVCRTPAARATSALDSRRREQRTPRSSLGVSRFFFAGFQSVQRWQETVSKQ